MGPKSVSLLHTKTRLELKQRYMQEGDAFLDTVLICDETWHHHSEAGSQSEGIVHFWRGNGRVHLSRKFHSTIISAVFWDAKDQVSFLNRRTINSILFL